MWLLVVPGEAVDEREKERQREREREREKTYQWDAGAQKKAGHTIKRGEEEVDQSYYTQQIYLTEECRSTE